MRFFETIDGSFIAVPPGAEVYAPGVRARYLMRAKEVGDVELRGLPSLGELIPNADSRIVAKIISLAADGKAEAYTVPIVAWRTNPGAVEVGNFESVEPVLPGVVLWLGEERLIICDTRNGMCWGPWLDRPMPQIDAIAEVAATLPRFHPPSAVDAEG